MTVSTELSPADSERLLDQLSRAAALGESLSLIYPKGRVVTLTQARLSQDSSPDA